MEKIQVINKCRQCRFGELSREVVDEGVYGAWCHEECRAIEDFDSIPEWCPLEDRDIALIYTDEGLQPVKPSGPGSITSVDKKE